MQWRLLPVWLFAAFGAGGQAILPDPELATLVRIRTSMANNLERQPNYTCLQQIERSYRRVPRRRFELQDVLRLEVALVEGKEMFAWPGARKFEHTDLSDMISGGAFGTGDFAMHARSLFQTSAPVFRYARVDEVRGRRTLRFDFIVPLERSGYNIRSGERKALVAYHGSIWADSATDEIVRLEVNADNIPAWLGLGEARDVMDYGRMRIGPAEFLLPVESELQMRDLAGNESRNRTQFKACRQYSGESVLTFAAPPGDDEAQISPPPVAKVEIAIPAGELFDVRLMTDIDSATSAVGDPVTAVLDDNLKSRRTLLFARGATLRGRISRLESHTEYTAFDLQFFELESAAARSTLLATVEQLIVPVTAFAPVRTLPAQSSGAYVRGNRLHLQPGTRIRLHTFPVPLPRTGDSDTINLKPSQQ